VPCGSLSSLPLPLPARAHLSISAAARHCGRGPPVSLSPPPLFGRPCTHAHVTRARWSRAATDRALSTGRQGPPCSCPASSTRRTRSPTPTAPCLNRLHPKRGHTTSSCLGPLFPPPSSLRAPDGQTPIAIPSAPPSEQCPPAHFQQHRRRRSPARCSASRAHFPSFSTPPHLSLSPWCRSRAPSSVTTAPAPPPSTATASHRPTAPPTRRQLGEPLRRFSCPAHLPHRLHALTLDPTAGELPVSRGHPRHRAVFGRGDRAPSRARWAAEPPGPSRCWPHPQV
jgi:hypothetical protein